MKNSKGKGAIGLILLLAAVAMFAILGLKSMHQINKGLDLAGGVSITYQTVEENPSSQDMDDTVYKLQQRVQNYSTEAEVYKEGSNRINIDIPGASDADAILSELGQPGSLQFIDPDGNVVINGNQVVSAEAGITSQSSSGSGTEYVVELRFNDEGTTAFAEATSRLIGQQIYIVYDNQVYSAPTVQAAITGGECSITGIGSYDEAKNLASTIRIGSLNLELTELRSNVVGAKLGQEAIATSKKAAIIGLIILAILMIIVFRLPGVAAMLALGMYCGLELCLLAAFDMTLTLAGIAGVILSIGMAVDANCIIFTRIKEEIGQGKSVRSAVKQGFHKALSAIIDGNVTTLIAALVLGVMGTGTVRGFAQTLALGVVLSMITAIIVTRGFLVAFTAIGLDNPKLYGIKKDTKMIDVAGKKKYFFGLAGILFIVMIAGIIMNNAKYSSPVNYSIDFKGGTSTTVTFNEDLSLEQLQSDVEPIIAEIVGDHDIQFQKVSGSNDVIIKTSTLSQEQRSELSDELAESFGVDEQQITAESISGAISGEMRSSAIKAVIISMILMLIYIWFRFKNIRFAASAVLCLVHDVMVLFLCYVIARWSVGSTFIACMLTLVGYSINDTIVIFDRIRENIKLYPKMDKPQLVNLSVSETMSRSIYTSLTTFIMIFVLYILGVESVKEFALPLMIGTVCGTYSSIAVASPLWMVMDNYAAKKKATAKAESKKKK